MADEIERQTLVIGCGFIGSRVVEQLLEVGEVPKVLTKSPPSHRIASRLPDDKLLIGDADDPAALKRALNRIDRIVYAAGGLLPAASEREPERDAELTLAPLRSVLGSLRSRPDVSIVYLSSGGTVYGDPALIPVSEDEPTRPRGVYGKLHVRCEREVLNEVREHGLRARVLRCSTVYGEGQQPDRGQGVIATSISPIERDEPIECSATGPPAASTLCRRSRRIIWFPLERGWPPRVNVGNGEGSSLLRIPQLI